MHHIVIDYQQRRQYILIFIASIIFSFGLGYWFGFNSISSDDLSAAISQIEILRSKSDQSPNAESMSEASSSSDWPANAAPSAEIRPVDKPVAQPVIPVKPVAVVTPVKPAVKPVTTTVAVPPLTKPMPIAPVTPPVQPVVVKPVTAPAPAPAAVTPIAASAPLTTSESITNTSLSAESANTQYAIQAGVFDSRENAMKLVNELNAKGFDAYIDEFVTGSGETKFNVRFGRNSDRDQVQKRLVRFKQLYTTAAYIITLDK